MNQKDTIIKRVLIFAGLLLLLFISTAVSNKIQRDNPEPEMTTEETVNQVAEATLEEETIPPKEELPEIEVSEIEEHSEEATYTVTFTGTWTKDTHPIDFPENPHFSPFVAVTHGEKFVLFTEEESSSEGIVSMAETGKTKILLDEIMGGDMGASLAVQTGLRIDSPGVTSVKIKASKEESFLSMVSMIAPSPDWFVSLQDAPLYNSESGWVESKALVVKAFDAGSDSGETYSSENFPNENGVLTFIENLPAFGSVTITKN